MRCSTYFPSFFFCSFYDGGGLYNTIFKRDNPPQVVVNYPSGFRVDNKYLPSKRQTSSDGKN
jgi:hypothetical protein